MHIAKVEPLIELPLDEGEPGRTRPSGIVERRERRDREERGDWGGEASRRSVSPASKSGTYAKAQVPWVAPEKELQGALKVCAAEQPSALAHQFALVSPDGTCRLVVMERGARWPDWLARELSGGVTTYLVAEAVGDGLGGLVQRVERRAANSENPVSQLIWLSAQPKRLAPLRWIKRLSSKVRALETIVVAPSAVSHHAPRFGARRQVRDSMWPRAVVA